MRAIRIALRPTAVALACCLSLSTVASVAAEKKGQFSRGRTLFVREWQAIDRASPQGDGLGPMFNARSCVACHNQGGVGGAGKNEHNVDVLSVDMMPALIARGGKVAREELARELPSIHSGLVDNAATTVLHRFSTDPLYSDWRDPLAPFQRADFRSPICTLTPSPNVTLQISQRSTPALFGAAAIDSLPTGLLRKIAARQAKFQPRIAGRVAGPLGSSPEGKFGWRGQIVRLNDFVRGACAAEVGLQLPGHAQSLNPRSDDKPTLGVDMSESDAAELVSFVASLPQPRQEMPRDPKLHSLARRGEMLFGAIGCFDCHLRTLGSVDRIYSDLSLHDMGEDLADLGADGTDSPGSGAAGYYGHSTSILVHTPDPKKQREWRTPPLWGVRDSAPYLHDGRAATLRDAIALHGGQGATAAKNFAVLNDEQQTRLLLFLNTLAAPSVE